MTSTDRIEKKLLLRAPRSRVWRAISDSSEFGSWFRVRLEGPFVAGQSLKGQITYPGYEHLTLEMAVERIEPERYFSYRWHPNATDVTKNYAAEPTTLVEFTLEEKSGGTELTITESGFDRIPESRRAEAFRMNEGGWGAQILNIEKHVTSS